MKWVFGANPKGFGTYHLQSALTSAHTFLSKAQALISSRLCPHMCGLSVGWNLMIRVGSRGALPRWRPPLTHTNFILGLGSQLCVESARLWGFGFRVLAFSLCINRGSFSSIMVDEFAENLYPYDCNFLSVLWIKLSLWRTIWWCKNFHGEYLAYNRGDICVVISYSCMLCYLA